MTVMRSNEFGPTKTARRRKQPKDTWLVQFVRVVSLERMQLVKHRHQNAHAPLLTAEKVETKATFAKNSKTVELIKCNRIATRAPSAAQRVARFGRPRGGCRCVAVGLTVYGAVGSSSASVKGLRTITPP